MHLACDNAHAMLKNHSQAERSKGATMTPLGAVRAFLLLLIKDKAKGALLCC